MSEHILAALKPEALTAFSTLDPLVTTNLNRIEEPVVEERKAFQVISRATRLLNAQTSNISDDGDVDAGGSIVGQASLDGAVSPPRVSDNDFVAATTLDEGAKPVREFSNMLTSEPASIAHSANSSVTSEYSDRLCLTHREELRCVVAITRHGDRTPKVREAVGETGKHRSCRISNALQQKLKLMVTEPRILEYYHAHTKNCKKDLKVKDKAPMTEFLQTIKIAAAELRVKGDEDNLRHHLVHMIDVLERWKIAGLNRKLQIKPQQFEEYTDDDGNVKERCTAVQLILKWVR
jgi:hypothetical protein